MHNMQNRLGSLLSFFVSVVMSVALVVGVTSHFYFPAATSTPPSVKLHEVKLDNYPSSQLRNSLKDFYAPLAPYIMLRFSFDWDTTEIVHWNTKQVFISLGVEYGGKSYSRNEIVLWDKILMNKRSEQSFIENVKLDDPIVEERNVERYRVQSGERENKYVVNHIASNLTDKLMDSDGVKLVAKWYITPYVGMTQVLQHQYPIGKLNDYVTKA